MKNHSLVILSAAVIVILSSFRSAPAKRVIFFGDSITQRATEENGYINVMHRLLDSSGRAYQYDLVGAGVGGDKIYDLLYRVDLDVISRKPDIVYVFIGVNDVWAKATTRTGTDPDKFDRFYDALVQKLKKAGCKIVICTPVCIGEKKEHRNPDDADLDRYAQLAREVAYRNNATVCDLRALFITVNEGNNPSNKRSGILTTDGVHLSDAGNLFVAKEMLRVIPQ